MKFNQFAVLLISTQWIISGNGEQVNGHARPTICCPTVTNTRIAPENIVYYSIQESPPCPIKAARFYTKKKKVICSDPNSDWAKRMIQKLDPNSIQTTTATHKIPGTHTETSSRTTVQQTATSTIQRSSFTAENSSRLIKNFRPRKKKQLRKIQMGISRTREGVEDGPPVSCCRLGDIRPQLDKILNYRIQTEEMCPIRAVLFQTVAGKTLCSDPESNWTKSAMWKVDEEQKKLREQDPVAVEEASVEECRGREDPVTTTMMTSNERPPDCCLTVTNIRIPAENIVAYSLQEPPLCSIKAVRFYTKKGKVICSDSNSNWAKTVIVKLRSTAEPHLETIQCHTTEKIQTTTATDKTPGTQRNKTISAIGI